MEILNNKIFLALTFSALIFFLSITAYFVDHLRGNLNWMLSYLNSVYLILVIYAFILIKTLSKIKNQFTCINDKFKKAILLTLTILFPLTLLATIPDYDVALPKHDNPGWLMNYALILTDIFVYLFFRIN